MDRGRDRGFQPVSAPHTRPCPVAEVSPQKQSGLEGGGPPPLPGAGSMLLGSSPRVFQWPGLTLTSWCRGCPLRSGKSWDSRGASSEPHTLRGGCVPVLRLERAGGATSCRPQPGPHTGSEGVTVRRLCPRRPCPQSCMPGAFCRLRSPVAASGLMSVTRVRRPKQGLVKGAQSLWVPTGERSSEGGPGLSLRAPHPAPPAQTRREGDAAENLDFSGVASVPAAPAPLCPACGQLSASSQSPADPDLRHCPFPHPQVERRKSFSLKMVAFLLFSLK